MTKKTGALIMAGLLALYLVLVGWQAVLLIRSGNAIAVVMGVALLVLPLIAAWGLYREIMFGIRSQSLIRKLEDEDQLDLGIAVGPTGRPLRAAADAAFDTFRAAVEQAPNSWRDWLRLGLAYDAAGDRRRARAAVRKAIELQRTTSN